MMKWKYIVSAVVAVSTGSAMAEQGIISVNYAANTANADQTIDAGETYGISALGTVVSNWHNVGYNAVGDAIWDDGSTSTVGAVVSAPGGMSTHHGTNTNMANTVLYAGPTRWGGNDPSFTIFGMANNFSNGYSVIVYLTGKSWSGDATISDGTTTYYYNTPNTYATNLIETTNTTGVTVPQATYAVFKNLSANALQFTLSGVANGTSIGGFQIIGEKGSFEVPPPAGVVAGWDAGATLSYKLPDAVGNMWGGPWPANAFAGSLDGTFGTQAGATDLFTMSTVLNNVTNGNETINITVSYEDAVPVRIDSLHFDIGRQSNAFDTVTLYELTGPTTNAVTNLIYTASGLPVTGSTGNFNDIDIMLTNISDNVLADGQNLRFLLVGSGAVSNDANIYLDNTAFFGEPISHYEGWAYTYGDIGSDTDDPDGDDLNNFGEYAFGGNPTNGNNVGYLPYAAGQATDGMTNYIEYVYTKRVTDGSSVNYKIEQRFDLSLGDWTNSTDAIEMGTGIVVSNQFESVTNWIPTDGKTTEFLRVNAEQ
ncbi:hypothetical protein PDESU_00556 [Pontiella desulfatans]|uniref:Uncharacterized protein n=1 Tax=Pontiella desulfatans TaxID=2750659 RepID=A0A6C2TWG3_PONDE|nr:hypothetical protein [Pontiella desulfatans]VGO12008.1 hypothetical protein PDESU_00556 [Pontiella desulfatans]